MASPTRERMKTIRADKMRMGKAACEVVSLVSNPEIQFALVPLTEGEFDTCQQTAIAFAKPDEVSQVALFEREFRRQVILMSARETSDLSVRIFDTVQEIRDDLDANDVNHLWEEYQTFTEEASPSLDGIDDERMDELKKAFVEADWKGLSGKSYWLLRRFLGSLSQTQLQDNLPGSSSTS